jgi:DNA-directed RNA polymerase sigma subunit (sigma70/sigma32)
MNTVISKEEHLAEMMQYPPLTADEEKDLTRSVRHGDARARRCLMRHSLHLVAQIAHHHDTPGISLMELIERGKLGLMRAMSKYDPSDTTAFTPFAGRHIEETMLRYIKEKRGSNGFVRMSVRRLKALRTFRLLETAK